MFTSGFSEFQPGRCCANKQQAVLVDLNFGSVTRGRPCWRQRLFLSLPFSHATNFVFFAAATRARLIAANFDFTVTNRFNF